MIYNNRGGAMKYAIFITFLFIISNLSFAQTNNFQITLKNNEIISQCCIEELSGHLVKISRLWISRWVKVDSIIEIRKVYKSKFLKGVGIGFFAGLLAGGLVGEVTRNHSGSSGGVDLSGLNILIGAAIGAATGTILGGVIGVSAGIDDVYDFSQLNLEQKLKKVEYIISAESEI